MSEIRFFYGIADVKKLKQEYHRMLQKYHPDLGGDVFYTAKLNVEYEARKKAIETGGNTYRIYSSNDQFYVNGEKAADEDMAKKHAREFSIFKTKRKRKFVEFHGTSIERQKLAEAVYPFLSKISEPWLSGMNPGFRIFVPASVLSQFGFDPNIDAIEYRYPGPTQTKYGSPKEIDGNKLIQYGEVEMMSVDMETSTIRYSLKYRGIAGTTRYEANLIMRMTIDPYGKLKTSFGLKMIDFEYCCLKNNPAFRNSIEKALAAAHNSPGAEITDETFRDVINAEISGGGLTEDAGTILSDDAYDLVHHIKNSLIRMIQSPPESRLLESGKKIKRA